MCVKCTSNCHSVMPLACHILCYNLSYFVVSLGVWATRLNISVIITILPVADCCSDLCPFNPYLSTFLVSCNSCVQLLFCGFPAFVGPCDLVIIFILCNVNASVCVVATAFRIYLQSYLYGFWIIVGCFLLATLLCAICLEKKTFIYWSLFWFGIKSA